MTIRKEGSNYVVYSESTHRKFGSYKTKKEAQKRLQQMEFFKHLKGSSSAKAGVKKKSVRKKK